MPHRRCGMMIGKRGSADLLPHYQSTRLSPQAEATGLPSRSRLRSREVTSQHPPAALSETISAGAHVALSCMPSAPSPSTIVPLFE